MNKQWAVVSLVSLLASLSFAFCNTGLAKDKTDLPKRALLVVTSHSAIPGSNEKTGYYLPEVTHPYLALISKGFKVDIASPSGGEAPMDPKSNDLSDPENKLFMETKAYAGQLKNTLKLSQVKSQTYSAIIFAGGHGTMWDFPDNKDIQRIASAIYDRGGVVAAVCHGPAALVNVKAANGQYLVSGKAITSFTNEEESEAKMTEHMPFLLENKLVERGAKFEKAPNWQEKVVVSQRVVTGQNPASAKQLGEEVAKLLTE